MKKKTWSRIPLLLGAMSLLQASCQYYEEEAWGGWIDFHAKASIKGAICGKTSFEYAVSKLGDEDDALMHRTLLVGWGAWNEIEELVSCINRASDCDEFWKCHVQEDDESCDDMTFDETCEGNTTVRCTYRDVHDGNNHFITRTDCSQAPGGGTCVIEDAEAQCQYNQCLPGAENPRCDGDLSLFCEPREYSYIYWMADCSVTSMQCMPEGSCGIPGAISCDGYEQDICDGPLIHSCQWDSSVPWSNDCREVHADFVCFMDEYDDARCGMPVGSWECETHEETWCDGSVFKACIYGKIISFDCASFAGSSCEDGLCTRQE